MICRPENPLDDWSQHFPRERWEAAVYRLGNLTLLESAATAEWWAWRTLAAARAVISAQMVDDPSVHPDLFPIEKAQEKERQVPDHRGLGAVGHVQSQGPLQCRPR